MANAPRPSDLYGAENEDRKGGAPPSHATEPQGSEGSSKTPKTRTDPQTGEPAGGRPETAG